MTLRAALLETESARRVAAAMANATLTWGAYVVDGVLSSDYADHLGVAARTTTFRCLESALPGISQGASVSVGGVSYTARAFESDAAGLLSIILERV